MNICSLKSRVCHPGQLAVIAAAIITASASASPSNHPNGRSEVAAASNLQPRVLYAGATDACDKNDGIDAPARAFRDYKDDIHLFAADQTNRQLVGRDMLHTKRLCNPTFQGSKNIHPAAYDDREWLASFYTLDGRHVEALVHNEFEGYLRPNLCPTRGPPACWEISIVAASSDDAGYVFSRKPGSDSVVASYPYTFDPQRNTFSGYMNPTNIVRYASFYYVLFAVKDPVNGVSGESAMRTPDIRNTTAWRGWDGKQFSVPLSNFTRNNKGNASKSTSVKLIAPPNILFGVGSVSFYPRRRCFVAILRKYNFGQNKVSLNRYGIYFSTSQDLLSWSPPKPILLDEDVQNLPSAPGSTQYYPSLLDPTSESRNFETVSDNPLLVTVALTHGMPMNTRVLLGWPVNLRTLIPQSAAC